jgi:hypothetical protein
MTQSRRERKVNMHLKYIFNTVSCLCDYEYEHHHC